eukprot:CAMPEP_0197525564 /NCGR_PEP_ID=MMETSP1318-20131121/12869_1 /TAXON_ID=552666 /ORGANISM="Partenskyella glossopodia, Strain RCC365" /LENGTH=785 /DNA_ID=CAMNT_0043079091 /DNA_START=164 /DNA_END=2521 /DNA_ORIENTATION=-
MFSASGMLSSSKMDPQLERADTFIAICMIAGFSTFAALGVSAKFFLPTYLSIAYTACIFLVPLTYRALGRMWVRFCSSMISSRCRSNHARQISKPERKKNFYGWFISMQFMLVLAFWSATLVNANGYLSESTSLLISFGCFNAMCVAVLVTHGVGGRLKHESYRFYQPFQGGMAFCILQALGWACFSLSLFFLLLHFLVTSADLLQFCSHCILKAQLGRESILFGASSTGVVSEILMALSLLVFHDEEIPKKTFSSIRRAFSSPSLASLASTSSASATTLRRPPSLTSLIFAEAECERDHATTGLTRSPSNPEMKSPSMETIMSRSGASTKKQPRVRRKKVSLLGTFAAPFDELLEVTDSMYQEGRAGLRYVRGLDNWGVEMPMSGTFSGGSLETMFRFLASAPILVAVAHRLSLSLSAAALKVPVYSSPMIMILSIFAASAGVCFLFATRLPTRRPKTTRTRERLGLGAWDSLNVIEEDSKEESTASSTPPNESQTSPILFESSHSQPRKIGLGLWDALFDHSVEPDAGFGLWNGLVGASERRQKSLRRPRSSLQPWGYLGDVADEVAEDSSSSSSSNSSSSHSDRKRKRRALDSWDFVSEVEDFYVNTKNESTKLKQPRQRGLDCWDGFGSADAIVPHSTEAETQTPELPSSRRNRADPVELKLEKEEDSEWVEVSLADDRSQRPEPMLMRVGFSVGAKRRKGGVWNYMEEEEVLANGNVVHSKQQQRRRQRDKRGLENWNFSAEASVGVESLSQSQSQSQGSGGKSRKNRTTGMSLMSYFDL